MEYILPFCCVGRKTYTGIPSSYVQAALRQSAGLQSTPSLGKGLLFYRPKKSPSKTETWLHIHTPIPAIQEVVCQLELHAYFLRKYLATLLKCIAQYWIAMLM